MTVAFDPLAGLTIADEHLESVLRGEEFLVFDGAMGTMMQAAVQTLRSETYSRYLDSKKPAGCFRQAFLRYLANGF